jgi:hypothetical protein
LQKTDHERRANAEETVFGCAGRTAKGHIDGNKVQFTSGGRIEGPSLHYTYKGTFDGTRMTGDVDLGEYGMATFSATRKA